MRIEKKVGRRKARVEIVPLIDAMFLVLAFFVYSMMAMTVHRGVRVDLPAAKTSVVDRREYLSIAVTEQDRVFLGEREVPVEELPALLTAEKAQNPDLRLYVAGDARAHHGTVVEVLDVIRQVGVDKVAIETRAPEAEVQEQ